MGYQVYWANGRWQGYGVPAYCDYPGCEEIIDRGMGYLHSEDEDIAVFCCDNHKYVSLGSFETEGKEHPEWLNNVLNDDSWKQWREENPETVIKYKCMLEGTK